MPIFETGLRPFVYCHDVPLHLNRSAISQTRRVLCSGSSASQSAGVIVSNRTVGCAGLIDKPQCIVKTPAIALMMMSFWAVTAIFCLML